MRFHSNHLRWTALASVGLVAALLAGCTNPPPAGGFTLAYGATSITNVTFVPDWPPTFWDPDIEEEPYLVHLGLRIKVTEPIAISTQVRSTYFNNGQYIGKIGAQGTLPMAGDGVGWGGAQLPDLLDLINGVPFELFGTIEFLLERDQLIPVGFVNLLDGVSQILNAALPTILRNGGALPTSVDGILAFLGDVLPGVFATILGAVGTIIGQIGGGDQLIGFTPQIFMGFGGNLGGFISDNIPTLLQIINFVLSQQNPNPFPNGLPIGLGVVGRGTAPVFGTAPNTSTYQVVYGWQIT